MGLLRPRRPHVRAAVGPTPHVAKALTSLSVLRSVLAVCLLATSSVWAGQVFGRPSADANFNELDRIDTLDSPPASNVGPAWEAFKRKFGKTYASGELEAHRRSVFEASLKRVREFNRAQAATEGYTLGVNQFSDMAESELFARLSDGHQSLWHSPTHDPHTGSGSGPTNGRRNSDREQRFVDKILDSGAARAPPDELDWRRMPGRVTQVKQQGDCSASWAFAVTGLLEGQQALHGSSSELEPLSEQELLDCSYSNYGCHGGWARSALEDLVQLGGVPSDKSYPYEGALSYCRFNVSTRVISISGSALLDRANETQLKAALAAYGPILVGLNIGPSFHAYNSGVYSDPRASSHSCNHFALLTGYGTAPEADYWIVKNSWGSDWGQGGYILMARNQNNNCGIATWATVAMF